MESLTQALISTMSSDDVTRKQGENYILQAQQQPQCGSALLEILDDHQPTEVKQAAAIAIKNMISRHWTPRELQRDHYLIADAERPHLRHRIFEMIIRSNKPIRLQLCVCLQRMLDHTFPEQWQGIDHELSQHLQSCDTQTILGALCACYAFTRKFRMRAAQAKEAYHAFLAAIAPSITAAGTVFVGVTPAWKLSVLYWSNLPISCKAEFLLTDHTDDHFVALRMVLKIYHNSGLVTMPPVYATTAACDHWNDFIMKILQLPAPPPPADKSQTEWQQLPYWKLQKWATKNLEVFFERYGLPKQCDEDMRSYAHHYINTLACRILETLMHILGATLHQYISPRVIRNCLTYMTHAVESSKTWKLMKPHLNELMDSILFPLMCQSSEDDELWENDPYEYVRQKYALASNYIDPVSAACTLIDNLINKRAKATLEITVNKCMAVARSLPSDSDYNPRHKDGALHILGTISDVIMERKKYQTVMEDFIVSLVLPEIRSPAPYMQRRACCFIENYAEMPFKSIENHEQVLYAILEGLRSDQIPVSVSAAISLLQVIENHGHLRQHLEDQLSDVVGKLLELLRDTDNDDLTDVLSRIIEIYADKLAPYGIALAEELVRAFERLRHYDPSNDSDQHKVLAAQGVMESICNISDIFTAQSPEQQAQFEGYVIQVLETILMTPVSDFIEDAVELIVTCTSERISQTMWSAFAMIYESFKKEHIEYFPEIMPPLYNFIKNGAYVLVEDAEKVGMLFEMIKAVWEGDEVEDTFCYVAKLMELMMTYLGSSQVMGSCVEKFLEMVVPKLLEDSEEQPLSLQAQCINVLIAGLCFNASEVLAALEQVTSTSGQSLTVAVLNAWFSAAENITNLHNRRSCIMGLCTLLQIPLDKIPASIQGAWRHIIPVLLHMFDGLEEAYQNSDSEEGEEQSETVAALADAAGDADGLADDEDYDSRPLQDLINEIAKKMSAEEHVTEEDSGEWNRFYTPYDEESYDVYVIVRDTLSDLQLRDANAYQALLSTPEQQQKIAHILAQANQREVEAAASAPSS
eukprot:gene1870-4966_t